MNITACRSEIVTYLTIYNQRSARDPCVIINPASNFDSSASSYQIPRNITIDHDCATSNDQVILQNLSLSKIILTIRSNHLCSGRWRADQDD
jgi:hypothetical protein